MIRRLRLVNYRSHQDTDFTLEPLTVFIGPVAAGKSNIFRGLTLLQSAMNRVPWELFGGGPYAFWAQRYRAHSTSTDAIVFEVEIAEPPGFPGEVATYRLELSEDRSGTYIAREDLERRSAVPGGRGEMLFRRGKSGGDMGVFGHFSDTDGAVLGSCRPKNNPSYPESVRFASAVANTLSRYGYYHLEAGKLRETSSDTVRVRRVDYDGSDLPGALAALRDQPETEHLYQEIQQEMRDLLPGLIEITLPPAGPGRIGLGFRYEGFDSYLTGVDASDGTLFTLGMLAVLKQPEMPAVLALEEPETGLHPSRLRWLVDKLWDLAHPPEGRSRTQVLISTHSPYLLDLFADTPEVVRIVEMQEGASRVKTLLEVLQRLGIDQERLRQDSLGRQWYAGVLEEFC